ncbi:SsrA-binding protein SmpB [Candidatus Babeliales bacterium]|nr:SsrA-binding protein SmpB [Candidatus Babeliales bacterium]
MKELARNKKAFFDYEINDTFEAGIVLIGDEVKSARAGNVSLVDAFATVHGNGIVLTNCYIGKYSHAFDKSSGDFTRRSRVLLLNKKEINRLIGEVSRKGMTLIPIKMYLNNRGLVKLEIGVAKHKKARDKKQSLKERDIKRETERTIKQRVS